MRGFRADLAAYRRAAKLMAACTGLIEEDGATALLGRVRRGSCRFCNVGQPVLKYAGRLRDDFDGHVRVLQAAELRAMPRKTPGLVASSSTVFVWPGIRSILRSSLGPEAVDDVGGRADNADAVFVGMWISFAVTAAVPG